jgi:membrane protein implicated in regulation of membrane protease activity
MSVFLWMLLGLLMILAEFFIPEFLIFFFGVGAIATGLFTLFLPFVSGSFLVQFLIWAGFSGISMLVFRRMALKFFRKKLPSTDSEVGDTAEVTEAIGPEQAGRIRYRGVSWGAISYTESFEKGEKVSILKKDGINYVVSAPLLPESDVARKIDE